MTNRSRSRGCDDSKQKKGTAGRINEEHSVVICTTKKKNHTQGQGGGGGGGQCIQGK